MNVKMVNITKEEEIKKRVEDNLGLIFKPTQKFYNGSEAIRSKYDFDELLSVATLSLYRASAKFDETRGYKFSTYAVPLIKYALIEFTRKDKWYYDRKVIKGKDNYIMVDRISTSTSIKPKAKSNGGTNLTVDDLLIDREDIYYNSDNSIMVDKLLSTCSERERKILKGYFFEEKSQTELSKEFETSQSYISVVIKRNLSKFKDILKEGVFEC